MARAPSKGGWERRRAARIGRLRLICAAAIAGAVVLAAWVAASTLLRVDQDFVARWIASVVGSELKLPSESQAALEAIFRPAPYAAVFLFFGGLAWLGGRGLAEGLHDKFLAEFNSDVLGRIRRPLAFDPIKGTPGDASTAALPWIEPAEGSQRRVLWDDCRRFVGRSTGRFSWAVIVGRSGSGKSRMAVHCARLFARRDDMNEADPRTRIARLASLVRRCVDARRTDDPWDAGLIGLLATAQNAEGVRRALDAWRPRRPTVLVLDDPDVEIAKACVDALTNAADGLVGGSDRRSRRPPFEHPVRLLIVNQTVPSELKLEWRSGVWAAQENAGSFSGQVLRFVDAARLSREEMRQLLARHVHNWQAWRGTDNDVNHLEVVTRGNPLYVEMAISWLNEGLPLNTMTRAGLVLDRAERVFKAVSKAGFQRNQRLALACATLAGGAARTDDPLERSHFARIEALKTTYGDLSEVSELASVFPADTLIDLSTHLPPVLPEGIGDAFVRLVIDRQTGDRKAVASTMVRTAWRANPAGMVRTIGRFARAEDAGSCDATAQGSPDELSRAVADLSAVDLDDARPGEVREIAMSLLAAVCLKDPEL